MNEMKKNHLVTLHLLSIHIVVLGIYILLVLVSGKTFNANIKYYMIEEYSVVDGDLSVSSKQLRSTHYIIFWMYYQYHTIKYW